MGGDVVVEDTQEVGDDGRRGKRPLNERGGVAMTSKPRCWAFDGDNGLCLLDGGHDDEHEFTNAQFIKLQPTDEVTT